MSNHSLLKRAARVIPGGVNSPVRSFKSVDIEPRIIVKGRGPFIYDVDQSRYIDYVGSWGASILGHNNPAVTDTVTRAIERGLGFGATNPSEIVIAERIVELMPSIEMVRLVNSGTEATMTAIRLARGYTGRDVIVKFEGCYHGHVDSLLVKAGSGALTQGHPDSKGIPPCLAELTQVLPFNDLEAVDTCFADMGDKIAAVIVEPIAGNMNMILPKNGFLNRLRERCTQHGAVLIFDEVMTGFRVGLGGAQGIYGIEPDLTTLGKVIGGGMPIGAVGGKADIMNHLSPVGEVYQAGTLSGNPISVAAGLITLLHVASAGVYDQLTMLSHKLMMGFEKAAKDVGLPFSTQAIGGMFGFFFRDDPPNNLQEVTSIDQQLFKRFFVGMLESGVYLAPSPYEAGFLSTAHDEEVIKYTTDTAHRVFRSLSKELT